MNRPIGAFGPSRQRVTLGPDGILCEDIDGVARFRRPGIEPQVSIDHRDAFGGLRRLGLLDGRLVAITAAAGWAGLGRAVRFMRADAPIEPWRIALFEQCGELVIEAAPPLDDPGEMVCECKGVTRGEIAALAATCGDRLAIGRACGAGTVCGGCAPRIDEIAGDLSLTDAELVAVERLGSDVARFTFRTFSDLVLADQPGAFVNVQAIVNGRRITRAYTIAGIGTDGSLDILVKRDPSGVFSRWLHDHATVESGFRLSAPQTTRRAPIAGRIAFIGAGIGITPAFMEMSPAGADDIFVHWSVHRAASPFVDFVRATAEASGCALTLHETGTAGRVEDWASICPVGSADGVIVCGPLAFQSTVVSALCGAGWDAEAIEVESFGVRRGSPQVLQHVESFDYFQAPIVAESFHLRPTGSVRDEAYAFLRQFYYEHGAPAAFATRWHGVSAAIDATGGYVQTYEELAFGARLAWRNSARCIGRFFWKSLQVRDLRHLDREEAIFAAILDHLESATNGGDILPIISVFRPSAPGAEAIRILNAQLILYAGHEQADGTILGDPKNVALTRRAKDLGWRGAGTRFDVLPVMIQIGTRTPKLFELPARSVLEIELSHPTCRGFVELGLRWFAVPAVSGMALDVGGIQYTAAPSNGFYMGTEIASGNFADPTRYDELARVAAAMGHDTSSANPLWRDQAMLDLNVAVLHSFTKAGVRILDHHAMSAFFVRFREAEAAAQRPSYGHWAWVMPPMGGTLSPIWKDHTLQKKILKPNYFYQPSSVAVRAVGLENAEREATSRAA